MFCLFLKSMKFEKISKILNKKKNNLGFALFCFVLVLVFELICMSMI